MFSLRKASGMSSQVLFICEIAFMSNMSQKPVFMFVQNRQEYMLTIVLNLTSKLREKI